MKILFIDNYSPEGHIQFNRIQIEALCRVGDVYTAMKVGYYEKIGVFQAHKLVEIPESYYVYERNNWMSLFNRFFTRLTSHDLLKEGTLNFVRKQINDDWDAVVFSHFEPLPLSRMKPLKNVFAICHQYKLLKSSCVRFVRENNRIKYTREIGLKYTIIALSESMKKGIKDLGVKNVEVAPHGFKAINGSIDRSALEKFSVPSDKKIIFSPSFGLDLDLMYELYNSESFNTYLEENNLFLVIKDKGGISHNSNVKVINEWITQEEYQSIFLSSFCLLLPYGDNTPYRESGVIMECFANNKPFLKINIPSLNNYNPYICYDSSFTNIDTIINGLSLLLSYKGDYFCHIEKIKDPYNNWNKILNS